MEKVLLVADATQIDTNTLDFACYIASLTHSKLTGIFLENVQERAFLTGPYMYADAFTGIMVEKPVADTEEIRNQCENNIRVFKDFCGKRNTGCSVYRDRGVPLDEVIHESRFADLLILDARTSFNTQDEAAPTDFAKKVLAAAECPVIIAPEHFNSIEEIVFAYDGSASSVFAIKQFTYLFPGLDEKAVTLLQVNEAGNSMVEDRLKIAEWLKSHFSAINIMTLNGKVKNALFGYLLDKRNTMVVMGAYGRSTVSQFFKGSSADPIIKAVNLPVFIAHH